MVPCASLQARGCRLAAACLTALLLNGCVERIDDDSGDAGRSPAATREVPLRVVEGGGRTLAFVPVSIDGEGPYMFALDTGASTSVVDDDIADRLDLPRTGESRLVSGILGTGRVPVAEVDQWRLGDVRLDPGELAVIDIGPPGSGGIQGLLGSDVLSEFGSITVDYDDGTLRLPPP